MCDSPNTQPADPDPLLDEYQAAEAEVQDLAAVLLRAIRRRDDLRRIIELAQRHEWMP